VVLRVSSSFLRLEDIDGGKLTIMSVLSAIVVNPVGGRKGFTVK